MIMIINFLIKKYSNFKLKNILIIFLKLYLNYFKKLN